MASDDQALKDAQYRKGLSIAYFNSVNSAITMMSPLITKLVTDIGPEKMDDETRMMAIKASIRVWRDWFLEEHKQHYLKNISNAGLPFDVTETIERIKKAQNMDELSLIWASLSADERHVHDVVSLVAELKAKFKNNA